MSFLHFLILFQPTDSAEEPNFEAGEARRLVFGDFELDCRTGLLRRGGRDVKLQPQPAKLLILLASRAGEVVTRSEIQQALWADDTFVDFEHGINFSIKQIRSALGDDAVNPGFLETLPRRGYRFSAGDGRPREEGGEPARSPYPGLLSFSREDAPFFFGREDELQSLWARLERRHLLALIGPSGAGKSSLLEAGFLRSRPLGWRVLLVRPGGNALRTLAQSLAADVDGSPRTTGDPIPAPASAEAVPSLLQHWRQAHPEVLLCVDAFEEIFTLNDEAIRTRISELLATAAEEWGVHVLIAMRDDFFIHCQDYPRLAPVFSEVMPLKSPRGPALRRALVEPARKCGHQFEDESLVAEILADVASERGALPLLAFAAARLWEKRDRVRKVLTREAYLEIGGVSGALAQHAEWTLSTIEPSAQPMVRQIFRNLTTAKRTRTAQDRRELLSLFADRAATDAVLRKLIDSRLLTSFERPAAGEEEAGQQIEIIHEALLSSWPRLVQWQAQDAEGAVFRDQLRQAATAWQERRHPTDLLWSGTSLRELALWRDRYPGRLTATEEAFAHAATRLAGRKRRRRRLATGALTGAALLVTAVTSSLWREARLEALRAEAAQLVALGNSELESYPTAALAYAIKSLEVADTRAGRVLAQRVLQRGPSATFTRAIPNEPLGEEAVLPAFSPNGEWLALGGWKKATVLHRSSGLRLTLGDYPQLRQFVSVAFGPDNRTLMTDEFGDVRIWSIPDGRELRRGLFEQGPSGAEPIAGGFLTLTTVGPREVLRLWPFEGGEPRLLGTMDAWRGEGAVSREWLAYPAGPRIYLRSFQDWSGPPRLLGEHEADVGAVAFSLDGDRLAASDSSGELRVWPTSGRNPHPLRVFRGRPVRSLHFDHRGDRLAGIVGEAAEVEVWDLSAPPDAEPIILRRPDAPYLQDLAFEPSGDWLVTTHGDVAFWAFPEVFPRVISGFKTGAIHVAFTPDGKSLVSASGAEVRSWPLSGEGNPGRVLATGNVSLNAPIVDSGSRKVIIPDWSGNLLVAPLLKEPIRKLAAFSSGCISVALGEGDRLVATAPQARGTAEEGLLIRLFDLETGELKQTLPPPPETRGGAGLPIQYLGLQFLRPGHILASHEEKGLFLFDLADGKSRHLAPQPRGRFVVSRDGRFVVGLTGWAEGKVTDRLLELVRVDLDGRPPRTLALHGNAVSAVALDPTDSLVATGSTDGTVRIGPVTGEEPYLLLRHSGQVWSVAFSPDGRFLASAGDDRRILLWPVPDRSKPPLHVRPRGEILSRLRSWTNLRALPDPASPNGWKLDRDPFPGWARRPES